MEISCLSVYGDILELLCIWRYLADMEIYCRYGDTLPVCMAHLSIWRYFLEYMEISYPFLSCLSAHLKDDQCYVAFALLRCHCFSLNVSFICPNVNMSVGVLVQDALAQVQVFICHIQIIHVQTSSAVLTLLARDKTW